MKLLIALVIVCCIVTVAHGVYLIKHVPTREELAPAIADMNADRRAAQASI